MARQDIYRDPFTGARVERDGDELLVTVPSSIVPQAQHTARLDAQDVDRLGAAYEHSATEAGGLDSLAEWFEDVEHMAPRNAARAARAFVRALDMVTGS